MATFLKLSPENLDFYFLGQPTDHIMAKHKKYKFFNFNIFYGLYYSVRWFSFLFFLDYLVCVFGQKLGGTDISFYVTAPFFFSQ